MKLKIIFCLIIGFPTYSRGHNCQSSKIPTNGCYFNGNTYAEGDQLSGICFNLTCIKDTAWQFEWKDNNFIHNCCSRCGAVDDPHFKTFDNHYYDWHGTSNYTMSQPKDCSTNCTYFPRYGIYGKFRECNLGRATCVEHTTYKVSEHTVVSIDHSDLTKVLINGHPVSPSSSPRLICDVPSLSDVHQILVWRAWGCILLQGIDFSVRACFNSLQIYTTVEHKWHLAGLCGLYSDDVQDDYHTRDCKTLPLTGSSILTWAKSWMTLHQKDDREFCPADEGIKIPSEITCNNEDVKRFNELCAQAIRRYKLQNAERARRIEDCVNDCCRNPETCERIWLPNAQELAFQAVIFGWGNMIDPFEPTTTPPATTSTTTTPPPTTTPPTTTPPTTTSPTTTSTVTSPTTTSPTTTSPTTTSPKTTSSTTTPPTTTSPTTTSPTTTSPTTSTPATTSSTATSPTTTSPTMTSSTTIPPITTSSTTPSPTTTPSTTTSPTTTSPTTISPTTTSPTTRPPTSTLPTTTSPTTTSPTTTSSTMISTTTTNPTATSITTSSPTTTSSTAISTGSTNTPQSTSTTESSTSTTESSTSTM